MFWWALWIKRIEREVPCLGARLPTNKMGHPGILVLFFFFSIFVEGWRQAAVSTVVGCVGHDVPGWRLGELEGQ